MKINKKLRKVWLAIHSKERRHYVISIPIISDKTFNYPIKKVPEKIRIKIDKELPYIKSEYVKLGILAKVSTHPIPTNIIIKDWSMETWGISYLWK
jgi:hypothetical protein